MSNGPNTTGLPNTADYNLGRGILYFQPTGTSAWRDLGNCTAYTISTTSETLQHFSSRSGLKTLDKEVTLSRTTTSSFTLDELNDENLSLFFSGGKASHTNVAVAGFTIFSMIPADDLELGRWYDIVNASGERAYDVDTTDLALATSNVSPVSLVAGTDYTLDSEMGRVFILSTSTKVATAISGDEAITAVLTAEATASDVHEVQVLTASAVQGKLKFIANNPANDGAKREYTSHSVNLKADGDLALIGEEYTNLGFTCALEADATADSASPTMTIRTVDPAAAA
jgi:hypothetical protein